MQDDAHDTLEFNNDNDAEGLPDFLILVFPHSMNRKMVAELWRIWVGAARINVGIMRLIDGGDRELMRTRIGNLVKGTEYTIRGVFVEIFDGAQHLDNDDVFYVDVRPRDAFERLMGEERYGGRTIRNLTASVLGALGGTAVAIGIGNVDSAGWILRNQVPDDREAFHLKNFQRGGVDPKRGMKARPNPRIRQP